MLNKFFKISPKMRSRLLIYSALSCLCYLRINIANAVSFALQMKYNFMNSQNCFFNDECFFDKFEAEEFFVEEQNQRQRTVDRVITIKNALNNSGNVDFGISERVLEKNLRAAIKNMETEFLCRDGSLPTLKNICLEAFENVYFKEQSWYYDESVVRIPECLRKTVEAHTFPVYHSERPVLACPTMYLDQNANILSYFTVYLSATDKCCKNRFSYYVFVDDVQETMPAFSNEVLRKSLEMESLEVHTFESEHIESSHKLDRTTAVSSISSDSTISREPNEKEIKGEDDSEGKFSNLPISTIGPVPIKSNTSQGSTAEGKKLLHGSLSKSCAGNVTVGTSAKVAWDWKIREVGPSRCYSPKFLRRLEEQDAGASTSGSQSVNQKPGYKSARVSSNVDYEPKTSGFKTAIGESKYTSDRDSKAITGQLSVKFTTLEPSLAKYPRNCSKVEKQSASRESLTPPIHSTEDGELLHWAKNEDSIMSQSSKHDDWSMFFEKTTDKDDSVPEHSPVDVSLVSTDNSLDDDLIHSAKNDEWLMGENFPSDYITAAGQRPIYVLTLLMNRHRKR